MAGSVAAPVLDDLDALNAYVQTTPVAGVLVAGIDAVKWTLGGGQTLTIEQVLSGELAEVGKGLVAEADVKFASGISAMKLALKSGSDGMVWTLPTFGLAVTNGGSPTTGGSGSNVTTIDKFLRLRLVVRFLTAIVTKVSCQVNEVEVGSWTSSDAALSLVGKTLYPRLEATGAEVVLRTLGMGVLDD